jgi:PAS domain S-box-containing protein
MSLNKEPLPSIYQPASCSGCADDDEAGVSAGPTEENWAQCLLDMQSAVSDCSGDLTCVMKTVLKFALRMVRTADGAAIDLIEDADVVTRASVGTRANEDGTRNRLADSLSVLCIETDSVAICHDVAAEPRMRQELLSRPDVRSILVVPLPFQGKQIGFLKLYSARPNAFSAKDVVTSQLVAGPLVIGFAANAQAHAERERTTTYRHFEATFDQAAVGIAHVAADGSFRLVNDRFCQIVGHTRDALLRTTFQAITHPDDLDADLVKVAQLLDGSAPTYSLEKRYFNADGGIIWVNLTVSLVRDEVGTPDFFVAVIEDISARRKAEAATLAKSRFLANMSHEIRTPMNAVLGFAELLLDGRLDGKERRQVQLILESGRAMMRLLNDVLDLSKVEAGHMTVEPEIVDIRHTLKSIVQFMQPVASRKGLELTFSVAPEVPSAVTIDRFKLRQILLNLIGNSLKFTELGSVQVHVTQMAGSDFLAFDVVDTGQGISPNKLGTVFEDFVQLGSGAPTRIGTGLGLSISLRLARLMGGDLSVTSCVGRGSTFTLNLPGPAASIESLQSVELLQNTDDIYRLTKGSACKILLVEDHDINQEYMMDLLGSLGVRTDLAINGRDAIAHVMDARSRDKSYDLVLMDVHMPELNGLEAAQEIRELGVGASELPIVALSANAFPDDIEDCLAAGMQGHLAKPLRIEELIAVLNRFPRRAPSLPEPLRLRYAAHKASALARVQRLVSRACYDDDELAEAIKALHKLAGTAGLFGEFEVGEAAKALEVGLRVWSNDLRQTNASIAFATLLEKAA